ncbi:MAG: hypothetical protein L6256_04785 [Propionicimonas sp.]|uniref:hypothetical protein n=1 Tax=Propionicimonas sp. TaxID=1955623 RepID=UPI001E162E13|nr:hypothetical protein [Propionicimonas sp.]MBU4189040.1 hypothetical protein [Actinomycetota bacterium]MBU4206248.1 hypothetical protein [Actinomycetota bacterium]MBU4249898.1 hypothetical protein [Actinomycetota bacterium]MBU4363546.1 hypothetical protein [Actinomycetota bacterium]MBU4410010.1 hypothetical protein [Actinomycetota bacterium]
MSVRLILAGLAVVGLTACAAPAPASTSSAPYQDDPAASVKSYGAGSKECASASAVVRGASQFTTKADAGTATQDDFDTAFPGSVSTDLPAEALPAFADLKATSQAVVGLSKGEAGQQLSEFSLALSRFMNVAFKICT